MKTNLIFFLCLLMLSACNKNEEEVEIKEVLPLSLNHQIVKVDQTQTIGELFILSGNGDYKIICPKKVQFRNQEIDYSENLLKVTVEEDKKIVVEYRSEEYDEMIGHFLIADKEGEKKIIIVLGTEETTGLIDIEEVEKRLIGMPDLWLE